MKNTNLGDNFITTVSQNKKVLFITTKNIDYIRNSQEINCLQKSAQLVKVIGYKDKSYLLRLVKIYIKLLSMSFKDYNLIFVLFVFTYAALCSIHAYLYSSGIA